VSGGSGRKIYAKARRVLEKDLMDHLAFASRFSLLTPIWRDEKPKLHVYTGSPFCSVIIIAKSHKNGRHHFIDGNYLKSGTAEYV